MENTERIRILYVFVFHLNCLLLMKENMPDVCKVNRTHASTIININRNQKQGDPGKKFISNENRCEKGTRQIYNILE